MKKYLYFTFLLLSTNALFGQKLVVSSATYQRLTSANRIAQDSVWDDFDTYLDVDNVISLGFTFQAFGNNYDTLVVIDGALLSLDGTLRLGMDEDLCDKGIGGTVPNSPILYETSGSAGNRVVKIEWQNYGFYGDFDANGFCLDSGNLQIWVYENPNKIEMRWGKSKVANPTDIFNSGKGATVVAYVQTDFDKFNGISLDGNPSNPDTMSMDIYKPVSLNGMPADGTVYSLLFDKISSVKIQKKISMYPYLRDKQLMLPGKPVDVKVFNAQGSVVAEKMDASGFLDLGHLHTGVYFVHTSANHKVKIMLP